MCRNRSRTIRLRRLTAALSLAVGAAACGERFISAGDFEADGGTGTGVSEGDRGGSPSDGGGGESTSSVGGEDIDESIGGHGGELAIEAECERGEGETRSVACGLAGEQEERRTCSAAGRWQEWTSAGDCVEPSECSVGATLPVEDGPCGYCGKEPRGQVCTEDGQWGEPEPTGECAHASCKTMPGDERPGYVDCAGESCSSPMNCCADSDSAGCGLKACQDGKRSSCDGPEDCALGMYCIAETNYRGVCRADSMSKRRCHIDADCSPPTPYCLDNRSKTSSRFGYCVAELPP